MIIEVVLRVPAVVMLEVSPNPVENGEDFSISRVLNIKPCELTPKEANESMSPVEHMLCNTEISKLYRMFGW